MKQFLLSNNAVEIIQSMRESAESYKASLCDAFADEVFNAISSNGKQESWRVLTQLQEYSHLIDCLTMADKDLED